MTHAPAEVAIEYEIADAPSAQRFRFAAAARASLLLAPAVVVAILFSIIPLAYLFQVSLTQDSSFFFTAEYTLTTTAKSSRAIARRLSRRSTWPAHPRFSISSLAIRSPTS